MKHTALLAFTASLLFAGCTFNAATPDPDYDFLVRYMPAKDRATVSEAYLRENTALAQEARRTAPWRDQITDTLFREYILPYSSIQEDVDPWRPVFRKMLWPLVKDCKTTTEAVRIINGKIWDLINVHYSPKRDKADQSPFHSMRIGIASCSGMTIILVDAFRAVGIPARFVGCNWTFIPGNHSWPEFWDNGTWHFCGDGTPPPVDAECWFTERAAVADGSRPETRIYAAAWQPTGTNFWCTWRPGSTFSDVPAHDITASYRRFAKPEHRVRIGVVVRNEAGERIPTHMRVYCSDTGAIIADTYTYDDTHDLNDHRMIEAPRGIPATIFLENGNDFIPVTNLTFSTGSIIHLTQPKGK